MRLAGRSLLSLARAVQAAVPQPALGLPAMLLAATAAAARRSLPSCFLLLGSEAGAARGVHGAASAAPITPQGSRARILDGRAVAMDWEYQLRAEVAALTPELGRPPGLAVVLLGDRPDSCLYVARKQEAAARAGIDCTIKRLPQDVSQDVLCATVASLCSDPAVDGVLVQLPLPAHLDEEAVMGAGSLDPMKDVDGFHPLNMGRMLMRGRARAFVPATPLGVMELLQRSGLEVAGRSAVVLGDSNVVGTPLSCLLRDRGAAAVTVCHRVSLTEWFEDQEQRRRARAMACLPQLPGLAASGLTRPQEASRRLERQRELDEVRKAAAVLGSSQFESHHLPDITRTADFLIVAVGHPGLVRGDWVKPGAVVIDVGINVVPGPAEQQQQHQQQEQQLGDGREGAADDGRHHRPPPQPYSGSPRYQTSSSFGLDADWQQPHVQSGDAAGGAAGSPAGSYHVVGDVAFEEVAAVASAVTPVPGGVGPMTISALLSNTIQAAKYGAGMLPWWSG